MSGPPRLSTWFYHPGSVITSLLLGIVGGYEVTGDEHVPRHGPFILAPNHISNLDPPIMGMAVGHRNDRIIHFMAKVEMKRWPLIGFLAAGAGTFFVRRGERDREAQTTALALLRAGRPIAVFPEGTRSRDGVLMRPHPGAAYLAMRTGVPVLPAGITGSDRIFRGRGPIPRRSRVRVRIGPAFTLEHIATGRIDREALAAGTDRIMRAIAELVPERQRGAWG